MIIKNASIYTKNGLITKDITLNSNDNIVLDNSKYLIIPGCVDAHVHLRDPGFEYKEDAISACKAAAKGGITSIIAMPNIIPAPDTREHVKYILNKIRKSSKIEVYQFGALTIDMKGQQMVDYASIRDLVPGVSDDGPGTPNLETLKYCLSNTAKLGLITAIHAESKGLGFASEAEYKAVQDTISITRDIGASIHFCHLSLKKSIEYATNAKKEGLDVSFEVTPHHLFLNEKAINGNTNFKMNPPLRKEEDREYVEYALINGDALCVSTDHAPHTKEEKAQEYSKAPCGIIGLETMIPLIYTNLVQTGKISLDKFVEITSKNAQSRFKLGNNYELNGELDNITVLDIGRDHEYTESEILSKSTNSPFIGTRLYGMPVLTVYKGEIVYKR